MISRACGLFFLCAALIGCSMGRIVPERFMTVDQAFDPAGGYTPPAENPDAMKKSIFNVPFEDVYRAVEVSMSQAQFNVESENKAGGVILATRTVEMPIGIYYSDMSTPYRHTFFYAASVKELGPRKTEVTIAAKVQGQCGVGNKAAITLMTMGVTAGSVGTWEENCFKLAGGMWVAGKYHQDKEFGQFLTFVRNNLIAAGVL